MNKSKVLDLLAEAILAEVLNDIEVRKAVGLDVDEEALTRQKIQRILHQDRKVDHTHMRLVAAGKKSK